VEQIVPFPLGDAAVDEIPVDRPAIVSNELGESLGVAATVGDEQSS
jgi:hypothetical protein